MKTKILTLCFVMCYSAGFIFSQKQPDNEIQKSGWSAGVLPFAAYNSDIGFNAGAVAKIFDYDDGSQYPDYKHLFYIDLNASTKRAYNLCLLYDSKYLIQNMRLTAKLNFFTEQMKNFFGFNGYEAYYDKSLSTPDAAGYKSRAFYWYEQNSIVANATVRRNFRLEKLFWNIGIELRSAKILSVNIDRINNGKTDKEKLPQTDAVPGLYEKYVQWKIIKPEEKNGGNQLECSVGLQYDSRDHEANPQRGCFSSLYVSYGQSISKRPNYSYLFTNAEHRQYFTLIPRHLTFAYRVGMKIKTAGIVPFFMLPVLGGSGTLRGIIGNRLIGNGVAYSNLELRCIFLRKVIRSNNFYLAFSLFQDAGMIVQRYPLEGSSAEAREYLRQGSNEKPHLSGGIGFYIAMNENFVLSLEYGKAYNPQDGKSGIYLGLDYMF